jgi:Ca-activated chloride channel family protein
MNILLFAGGSAVYSATPVLCTAGEVTRATEWLDANMRSYTYGSGTELLLALQRAFDLPRLPGGEATARTIVVMTDGWVTVEREAISLVRSRTSDANVFALGIGNSVNRYIIDGLARAGNGEAFVAVGRTDGATVVAKLQAYIDAPLLTRLALAVSGDWRPAEMEPPALPDVFASRPVLVVGKWSGSLSGAVSLSGYAADGSPWSWSCDVGSLASPDQTNPSIPLLWARARIALISDYRAVSTGAPENWAHPAHSEFDEHEREAITALGLGFGLMTELTSFVAVDSGADADDTCARPEHGRKTEPQVDDMAMDDGGYGGGYGGRATSSSSPRAISSANTVGAWQRQRQWPWSCFAATVVVVLYV